MYRILANLKRGKFKKIRVHQLRAKFLTSLKTGHFLGHFWGHFWTIFGHFRKIVIFGSFLANRQFWGHFSSRGGTPYGRIFGDFRLRGGTPYGRIFGDFGPRGGTPYGKKVPSYAGEKIRVLDKISGLSRYPCGAAPSIVFLTSLVGRYREEGWTTDEFERSFESMVRNNGCSVGHPSRFFEREVS